MFVCQSLRLLRLTVQMDCSVLRSTGLSGQVSDPNLQASICRKFIEKVEVSTAGIKIHYHVGDYHYEKELGRAKEMSLIEKDWETENSGRGLVEKSARPFLISRPLAKY